MSSLGKLPFDVQLRVFQHVPDIPIISKETKDAQIRVQKVYPSFYSEDSLSNFDDWHMVKECDVSDNITTESKKFIYSKLLNKPNVKSFQVMNKWRAELLSDCHCHVKRLRLLYVTDLDLKKLFTNITVGELSIIGNKWNSVPPLTLQLIKQKCQVIVGPPELLKLFE